MAFQPAPAVAQAVLRFGTAGSGEFSHANVLNYDHDSGTSWTEVELQTLADELVSWWAADGAGNNSSAYQLLNVETRGMDSQIAPQAVTAAAIVGTAAGDPLPPNVAACITLSTGLTGRSARGRFYLGGLSESQSGGASLLAGNVTGINNMFTALLIDVNAATAGHLAVLSREQNGVTLANAVPYAVISASLRDAVLDTQRRRINRLK